MEPKLRQLQTRAHSRLFTRVALLVAFCLISHSFDICAAHTDLPDFHAVAQTCRSTKTSSGATVICKNCPHPSVPEWHGCSTLSEHAVLNPTPHIYPDYQPIVLPVAFTHASQVRLPVTLSGSLHGRDGPSLALLSSSLRASLPNRAPPLSA